MNTYDAEIERGRREIAEYRQLQARLNSLYSRREELAAEEAALHEARLDEAEDVEQLEGRSLMRYIYSLTGSLEERLDRERMEARAAAVKHDSVLRELEDVDADINAVGEALAALRGCEERYEAAIERKAQALKASGTSAGRRLAELERVMAENEQRRRETEEAVRAGQEAEAAALDVINSLQSASDWGTLDLFTDSTLVNFMKYGKVDEAQYQMEQLRVALRRFSTELSDVGAVIDVNTRDFLGFADFFFDGIIFDLAMNSRINNSLRSVDDTLQRIRGALGRLMRLKSDCEARSRSLEEEYGRIIAAG